SAREVSAEGYEQIWGGGSGPKVGGTIHAWMGRLDSRPGSGSPLRTQLATLLTRVVLYELAEIPNLGDAPFRIVMRGRSIHSIDPDGLYFELHGWFNIMILASCHVGPPSISYDPSS